MGTRRLWLAALVLVLAPFLTSLAEALVDVNKSFAPVNRFPGQTTLLTISLFNPNTDSAATGTALTDTLPTNIVVADPPLVANTCGGTVTVVPGSGSVSLTGGTIPPGRLSGPLRVSGGCSFTVGVTTRTGNTAMAGTYVNAIPVGAVTSSQGSNTQQAEATLTITPLNSVTGSKSFNPTNVHGGGTTVMTITLNNPNPVPLTDVALIDPLPTALRVASPANATTTCTDGTVTATPGTGNVRLDGGQIPANRSCTVRVTVAPADSTAPRDSNTTNSIPVNALTTAQGVSNPAAISGAVRVQTGAQVSKAFAPSTIPRGGTTTLTLTLRNFNRTALTDFTFSDALPAGLTASVTSNTCGGAAAISGNTVTLSGPGTSIAAAPAGNGSGSCLITVNVTSDTAGNYTNTVPAGQLNGVDYSSTSAALLVTPTSTVNATKSFSPTSVPQTGLSTLTIRLNNTGTVPATITSFLDDLLATMGAGITIASAPPASTNCGGTLTATPGSTSISLAGGAIPAQGNCQIAVPVTAALDASATTRTNRILAGALVTDAGSNAVAATANLNITRAATVAKSFAPATVAPGGISRLTITISHANGAVPFTAMAITDAFPAGHVISTPANATNTCGGTLTATPGESSMSLTGAGLGAGSTSCQIRADVQAPPGAGSVANTIPVNTLVTAEGVTNGAAATATLTRITTFGQLTLNKSFEPVFITGGAPSTLRILIQNTNPGSINLTDVRLTDAFPTGMEVHTEPNASFTGTGCSGGSITAAPESSSVAIAGATINANSVCTLSVNVTGRVEGLLRNDIPVGAATSREGVSSNNNPAATIAIDRGANIGKRFVPPIIPVNGTSMVTVVLYNANPPRKTVLVQPRRSLIHCLQGSPSPDRERQHVRGVRW